jgi:hypothetical protein
MMSKGNTISENFNDFNATEFQVTAEAVICPELERTSNSNNFWRCPLDPNIVYGHWWYPLDSIHIQWIFVMTT